MRPQSLSDVLMGLEGGHQKAFTFIADDGKRQRLAHGELLVRAKAVAAGLQDRGLRPDERVVLILPDAHEFLPSFMGIVLAGAVPVPVAPPMSLGRFDPYLAHITHLVTAAAPRFVVTRSALRAMIGSLHQASPTLADILTFEDLNGNPSSFRWVARRERDLAFIQFTSGSTSRPKGVAVTHGNIVANCGVIAREGLKIQDTDSGVSWLPLYHDMGLIGMALTPLYAGSSMTFLSPLRFLKDPSTWLRALSDEKATVTYAPNFAYGLCTRRVPEAKLIGVDLSHVRVAGCGAEPIYAETLRSFAKHYAPYGFREEAFKPSYGMAESTLAVTMATGLKTEHLPDGAGGGTSSNAVGSNAKGPTEVVSCGTPFSGHELRVVDPDTGRVLDEGLLGEIQVRGPSVMEGYYQAPPKDPTHFAEGGWYRSGDLGYLRGGELFVCGRSKDLIIVNGKKYHPQDIEWAVSQLPAVRTGNVVAFSHTVSGETGERVVVLAEFRGETPEENLDETIRSEVNRATGLSLSDVRVVPPGSLPKTSSGKLQRSRAKQMYLEGIPMGEAPEASRWHLVKHLAKSQWHQLHHRWKVSPTRALIPGTHR